MPVDNPLGNDETLAVIDKRERRMREGAERGVSRVPWGLRRVRLASGLWPRGIKTQLNFKMICATPRCFPSVPRQRRFRRRRSASICLIEILRSRLRRQ